MKSSLGCFTIPGIVTVVLSLLVFGGITLFRGEILFTPGALNAQVGTQPIGGVYSHAGLSENCAACHPAPWQTDTMSNRCVACHTDVVTDPPNFHLVIMSGSDNCRVCHSEHHGVNGLLTTLDESLFPHAKLGYSLTGHRILANGSPFACSDCHGAKISSFDINICTTCHDQIDAVFMTKHLIAFGQDCLGCHDGVDVYGKGKFDHNKIAFQLTGKHAAVDCGGCHAGAKTSADLKATPQDCFSCHAKDDPHQGRMGQDCATCHTPEDWSKTNFDHSSLTFILTGKHTSVACLDCHLDANLKATPQDCFSCHAKNDPHLDRMGQDCASCHTPDDWTQTNFDHSKFVFNLTGKHTSVACLDCHLDANLKTTPQDCYSCHNKDDMHKGELGQNCAICHSTDGWTSIVFDHSTAPFRLIGKHTNLACSACHKDFLYKDTPQDCYSCHSKDDVHQGQLGQNCATCHTPVDWTTVNFDHSTASFKLIGKHATLACNVCHKDFLFKSTPKDCNSCHSKDDVHNGTLGQSCDKCHTPNNWTDTSFDHSSASFKLNGKHATLECGACHQGFLFKNTPSDCKSCHAKDDAHHGQFGSDCGFCHTTDAWLPSTFDHSKTRFPLTGKHASAACSECHPNGQFSGTSRACSACHAKDDAHKGQFGADCSACHTTGGWLPATFDHSKSPFPLTGAHAKLACNACHSGGQFQGTPTACVGCHSEPAFHAGLFGTGCAQCHNTTAWQPASFNQAHTFPMNHGGASSCNSCHPSTLSQYNCFGCHDQTEMVQKHQAAGITNISNCIGCHPTGLTGGPLAARSWQYDSLFDWLNKVWGGNW